MQTGTVDLQFITQATADIAAMLGHASYEISLKRRQCIKSVIKDKYRYLCFNSQEITDYLFGANLEERIKEINLTNRLANNKPQYRVRPERVTGRYRPYPQRSRSNRPFLGRGRGTCHRHNLRNITDVRKARSIKSTQVSLKELMSKVENFKAGQLSTKIKNWKTLTKDRNILNIIKGDSIDFINKPPC